MRWSRKKVDRQLFFRAKLCKFYGWLPEYVEDMDYGKANEYWLAITVLESQDSLVSMEIADWPNMKESQRKKVHRNRYKQSKMGRTKKCY